MSKRIIFVDKSGTIRAPMASEIYKSYRPSRSEQVTSKGLVAAFPEPINPKVAAVLASDGINTTDFTTGELSEEDFAGDSLIFAVDENIREAILKSFSEASEENTFSICGYVGEELDIMDPYGGTLQSYGICYESMKNVIKKLIEALEGKNEQ